MSRSDAIRYCHQPHSTAAVMISISDPYIQYASKPKPNPVSGVREVLYLAFCDADVPGKDVYGRNAGISDLMTVNDARRVASFVKRNADKTIIVHCDAGISRSAGVAAAILKWATGDDAQIFKAGRYCPNMWAYRKTLEALMC